MSWLCRVSTRALVYILPEISFRRVFRRNGVFFVFFGVCEGVKNNVHGYIARYHLGCSIQTEGVFLVPGIYHVLGQADFLFAFGYKVSTTVRTRVAITCVP